MIHVPDGPRRQEHLIEWLFEPDPEEAGDWPLHLLVQDRHREVRACGRIVCGSAGCQAEVRIVMDNPDWDMFTRSTSWCGGSADPCFGDVDSGVQTGEHGVEATEGGFFAQDVQGVGEAGAGRRLGGGDADQTK